MSFLYLMLSLKEKVSYFIFLYFGINSKKFKCNFLSWALFDPLGMYYQPPRGFLWVRKVGGKSFFGTVSGIIFAHVAVTASLSSPFFLSDRPPIFPSKIAHKCSILFLARKWPSRNFRAKSLRLILRNSLYKQDPFLNL